MYELKRTKEEIDEMLKRVAKGRIKKESVRNFKTYEEGLESGIAWLLGLLEEDEDPMLD